MSQSPVQSRNMKKIIKLALLPVIKLIRYVVSESSTRMKVRTAIDILGERANESTADYIEKNLDRAMIFHSRESLWDYSINKVTVEGLFTEFGVWNGYSINYISKKIKTPIYGFDSFEGLREDWLGTPTAKGSFDIGGKVPTVNSNVILNKGWFHESIPNFLQENAEPLAFIHFDADTYESTTLLLSLIGQRIISGTIVVFDEYFGVTNWENGEYRAWKEFVDSKNICYRYLAFAPQQVSIVVL